MDIIKKADISLFGIDDENKNDIKSIYATKIKSSKYPAITYKSTILTDDDSVGIMETLPISSLTNGEVYNISKNEKYVIFKTSGSITLKESTSCDILVVGGGGGGGYFGGGGGAGQVLYTTGFSLPTGTHTITVGDGGAGVSVTTTNGNNGQDSSITISGTTYTAKGGGGGGTRQGLTDIGRDGNAGGSGGGASHTNIGGPYIGGVSNKNTYSSWTSLGNAGGNGKGGLSGNEPTHGHGGGGGAGSIGGNFKIVNGVNIGGGDGGAGINLSSIFGTSVGHQGWFAGGGGGGNYTDGTRPYGNGGQGLLGGGGAGSVSVSSGGTQIDCESGLANTGGGGGGTRYYASGTVGNGGSGVVIIRFKTNEITSSTTLVSGIFNYETIHNLHYANNSNLLVDFDTGKIDVKAIPTTLATDYVELYKKPFVWYKFDDTTDLGLDSMNLHNLTNPNGVASSTDFKRGTRSASFDGTNDFLTKDGSFNLNSKSWSVSVWCKKTNNNRTDFIFELGTGNTAYTTLTCGYENTNNILFGVYSDDLRSSATYTDAGIWVHLCFTFLTGTKQGTIYRNGVQINQKIFSAELNTNNNFRIGKLTTNYFQGLMDDFRIYDYELTPQEVNILYNNRYIDKSYPLLKDNTGTTINPLVWYKFDDSTNLGLDSTSTHNLANPNGVAFSTDTTKGLGSASFDGTNDHLTKDGAFNLNNKSFSISFWFKRSVNNRNDWLFQIGSSAGENTTLFCYYTTGNQIIFGNYFEDLTTTNTYTDAGSWIHLCLTYLTGTKIAIIYRNGINVAQKTFGREYNTNNNFRIGSFLGLYCQGLMDDFRIYQDKVLTPAEVNELYRGRVEILATTTNKTFLNQTNPYLLLNNTIDGVSYLLTTKPSTFEKKNTKRYLFNIDRNIKQLKLTDKARLAIKSITIPTVISKSYLQSKAINNVIIKMIPIPMDRYISDSSLSSGNPILFSIPLKTNSQGFGVTYNADQNPDKLELAQRPRLNYDNNGYLFINPNPDHLYNFSINQSFLDNGYFEFEVIYDIGEVFQDYVTTNTFNFIQETLDYNTDRDNLEGFNINFIITDIDDSGEKVYNEMSLLNKINRIDILNP